MCSEVTCSSTYSNVAADEAADALCVSSYSGRLLSCAPAPACSCVREFLFQRLVMQPFKVMSVTRARCCLARLTGRAQRVRRRRAAVLHASANFSLSTIGLRAPRFTVFHEKQMLLFACQSVTTPVRMLKLQAQLQCNRRPLKTEKLFVCKIFLFAFNIF